MNNFYTLRISQNKKAKRILKQKLEYLLLDILDEAF